MIATFIFGIANFIIKGLGKIASILLMLLPPSPFQVLNDLKFKYLDSLNWVIPISFFVTVLGYWVLAIAVYYVVQVGLRWVKVVE